jgi:hypothetical protein
MCDGKKQLFYFLERCLVWLEKINVLDSAVGFSERKFNDLLLGFNVLTQQIVFVF